MENKVLSQLWTVTPHGCKDRQHYLSLVLQDKYLRRRNSHLKSSDLSMPIFPNLPWYLGGPVSTGDILQPLGEKGCQ